MISPFPDLARKVNFSTACYEAEKFEIAFYP